MGTTWIVSANAGRARILESSDSDTGMHDLTPVHDMVSPTGRMQTAEIDTDRTGNLAAGKSSHGTGGATPNKTYQPAVTPEQHEAEKFARSLCDFLQQAQVEGRFQHLILVAEPQFLGVLRKELSPQMQPLIREEHNKDYTQLSNRELAEQLHRLREQETGWAPPQTQQNPASQTFR
jgi:protein required for attachment to host cells